MKEKKAACLGDDGFDGSPLARTTLGYNDSNLIVWLSLKVANAGKEHVVIVRASCNEVLAVFESKGTNQFLALDWANLFINK